MSGSLQIQSNQVIGQSGSKVIGPLIITSVGASITITDVPFASATSQTITSPAGATAAVVSPPAGNLVGLTLKGVAGDTGIAIQPNQPFVVTFAVPTSSNTFVLTSAGAIIGNVEVNFI